ncbi:PREDICTED: U-box domain-containing protein 16 [Nelumbo nucifera]|uniref:RING-type E3 ubiquitin transferase n=2 Tax=Nelumbo nucifera TaxID=4432 RepID=A0A822XZL5_NELNU|nr:PREDICTED: U-box domain-containing protein 16 [Nelumbo nucifera]DAD25820.1 TPA_asm: hypothetical protein HUJ06_027288 [Nelumbo nucifera]
MAISPQHFPPRKRRPSAGSFISPNVSDRKLVQSLLLLSQEISDLKPLQFLLSRASSSIIRKSKLLAVLFEEILRTSITFLPQTAVLCFQEIYIVLQRIKTLIEDCSNGSKMWLLMQNESVANSFHELTLDLSTLLDIFPVKDFDLSHDVKEIVLLVRKQCRGEIEAFIDPGNKSLRHDVLKLLDQIKQEIVPDQSKLAHIFDKLGLRDSISCRDEIESLQDEVRNQNCEKSTAEMVALMGLVRYGKCVLFGASTPTSDGKHDSLVTDTIFPADFRCPISLELMRDPVVVATGHTYDRASIGLWIDSGHKTCPKTGQTLSHTNMIPNLALKNLILLWCREQKIPIEAEDSNSKSKVNSVIVNKAALEATKMTATFLVNKLSSSPSTEAANRIVHELRVLAKTDSDSRACIAEAGAITSLVRYLGSEDPNLQVNAVTTILNLSILDANKTRIMETNGVLDGVIGVLRSGVMWEARGNAAATIFSLTAVHDYRKKLGRKTRIIKGLIELAKAGPSSSKRDALAAILNLAGEREVVKRLVEGGIVETVVEVVDELPEEAVTILAAIAKRGGALAVASANQAVRKIALVLRNGPERARESAASALVSVCRNGGQQVVALLAETRGIERAIWELMGGAGGTARAKQKAASLLRILRRWSAGVDYHQHQHHQMQEGFSSTAVTNTTSRTILHV